MSKIRKSAKGQQCQIRIPNVCNHNPETTVLAHLNGAGMGIKHADLFGAYACSDCHDAIDGRHPIGYIDEIDRGNYFYEGMVRTQKILLKKGLIKID